MWANVFWQPEQIKLENNNAVKLYYICSISQHGPCGNYRPKLQTTLKAASNVFVCRSPENQICLTLCFITASTTFGNKLRCFVVRIYKMKIPNFMRIVPILLPLEQKP